MAHYLSKGVPEKGIFVWETATQDVAFHAL